MKTEIVKRLGSITSYESGTKSDLKHKIYISVNGEGYGHSSRALAIAKELNPDEVILGSYGYVLQRLKKTVYHTVEVSPEISFVGEDGSFDIGLTILKNSSWPVQISNIIREEKKIIKNYNVTCVISDSRSAPIFAAHSLGIPCILLTNQTTFAPFFDVGVEDIEKSLLEKSFKDWLRKNTRAVLTSAAEPFFLKVVKDWLKAADEIFIPDLPPPNSICLPLLCNQTFVKKKQRFIGPLLPWSRKSISNSKDKIALPEGYKKKIVCTLGGHKYRKPLFDVTVELAKLMSDTLFIVLSDFRTGQKLDNLHLIGFVENPAEYYINSDVVITQAGHSTLVELITLGIPMIVVPDNGQVEQESNAKRICELGVGIKLTYKDLTPTTLYQSVNSILHTTSYYNSSKKLSEVARQYVAEEEAARLVRDFSTRIQAY